MNDFAVGSSRKSINSRLPPEVNRILYVRNLPFKITAEELYDIFGKYGAVYQIRLGERSKDTRGTAFVGECSCTLSKWTCILCSMFISHAYNQIHTQSTKISMMQNVQLITCQGLMLEDDTLS